MPYLDIVYYKKCTQQIFNVTAGTIDVVEYLVIFLVCWLLKVVVFWTCFQRSDLILVRHGKHLLGSIFCICFLNLSFSILLLPETSLKFLSRLNAVIGWQLNISFRDSNIAGKFQFFLITLPMFGKKQLKIYVSGMRVCFGFSLTFL